MKILKYIGFRLLLLVPQLLAISFVTFGVIRILPGDPARLQLGPLAPEATVEKLRSALLLDRPIWEQYVVYLEHLAKGDFGRSWVNGTAVADDLATRVPVTLELIFLSLLAILFVLVPLAIVTASDAPNPIVRILQKLAMSYAMLAGALPDFLLGLLLIFIFFTTFGWLPGPEGVMGILDIPPDRVTGFLLVDCLIAGDFELIKSVLLHMVMPVATLAFVYGAPIFKMLRSRMEEEMVSDFTIYGTLLGLPRRTNFLRALRMAAGPTLVMTGVISGFLLGGAVLVESVFNLNGIGLYAVKAIAAADYAPLQGFILVSAIFTAVAYLLVDIATLFVDPRLANVL